MPQIEIDGKQYEVDAGQNLLEACISLRLNVPYFCWHPAMGSAGACRQCAVKQYANPEDTRGRIVMSCMTPVGDGQRFSILDNDSLEFRASVIEFLMTNHPHDCPVCDEGGECHLQDMTLMSGHSYREYRFEKRTYKNQYLGPLINHEMNRCIQCYRCVRYYNDYAGGDDLQAFASKNHVYFGRHEDGVLENEFSGNLVEVCPTGVFTDATQKQHYTRRWDLQTAPSVCVHCSIGCNTIPGERYGTLRRVRNRYNSEVNGFFLCDRGRYGYEFVNSPRRVKHSMKRGADGFTQIPRETALKEVSELIADRSRLIGIGSPRASLESNFSLRELVGPENFSIGLTDVECTLLENMLDILHSIPVRTPSLREIAEADAILILGEDLTNYAPMMALNVRQAVRNAPMEKTRKLGIPDWNDLPIREMLKGQYGPFYTATPAATKLDPIATHVYHAAPADIARLGFAIANAIDGGAPAVDGVNDDITSLAQEIAAALKAAKKSVIISGPSLGSNKVIQAAANVALALHRAGAQTALSYTAPECNSMGIGLIGGMSLEKAAEKISSGAADTVIVLENDLYRRMNPSAADAVLSNVKNVVMLGHTQNPTMDRAHYILPADTFPEGDGTLVNHEGRAQRYYQVMMAEGDVQEGWRWLLEVMCTAGRDMLSTAITLDSVLEAMAARIPRLHAVPELAPSAKFRIGGRKIPRQTHRYSGRTAMKAHVNVSEGGVPHDPDTLYAFTMEGFLRNTPPALVSSFWSPGWNSPQAVTRFQEEIGGALRGGEPGLRLIEPTGGADAQFFGEVPAAFAPAESERLFVPLYHIFGSEELSVVAPGIAELSPKPYVALNAADAEAFGVAPGDAMTVTIDGARHTLPVKIYPSLPPGTAGLPIGLTDFFVLAVAHWGSLARGSAT